RDNANIDGLNVARVLIDGEHIHVGDGADAAAPAGESAGSDPSAAATTGGLINLNHADQATLETLPGVGPAIAERIITWREANGGFHTPEDVQQVSGIGPKVFADLQPLITAP